MVLWAWAQNVKICVFNAYQIVPPGKRYQKTRQNDLANCHQSACVISYSSVRTMEAWKSSHDGRNRDYAWAQEQGWSSYSCSWMPNLPATETNPEPLLGHYFSRRSTTPLGGKLITLDLFNLRRGSDSSWLGLPHMLLYKHSFPLPHAECWLSKSLTSVWSIDMASHGFLESLDQGTHFTAKEVLQWAYEYRIHWSCHLPHHPEATSPTEGWNDFFP